MRKKSVFRLFKKGKKMRNANSNTKWSILVFFKPQKIGERNP